MAERITLILLPRSFKINITLTYAPKLYLYIKRGRTKERLDLSVVNSTEVDLFYQHSIKNIPKKFYKR